MNSNFKKIKKYISTKEIIENFIKNDNLYELKLFLTKKLQSLSQNKKY